MMSVTHGVPQDESTCLKLIHGFIRINRPSKYFVTEIASIIGNYYIGSWSQVSAIWQITKDQIRNKDFTNIKGPKLVINDFKFQLDLARSGDRLYFVIWYQGSQQIQKTLYKHFTTNYNKKIANKIVNSFNDSIKGQELDEILVDLDDVSESFILSHVEKELNEDELLAHHQIGKMKQDIVDIVGDKISFMFNYNITIQGGHMMQFRKLERFNIIQEMEQKVEMVIAEVKNSDIKVDLNLEIFDDEYYVDGDYNYKRKVNQEWDIAASLKNRLSKMRHTEIVYIRDFSLFTILINMDNGLYNVYLQLCKPHFHNSLDPMLVIIDEMKMYFQNAKIFKLQDFSFTADKYVFCGTIKSSLISESSTLTMGIEIEWH